MPEPVERLGEARVWQPPDLAHVAGLPSRRVVTAASTGRRLWLWDLARREVVDEVVLPAGSSWTSIRSAPSRISRSSPAE